MFNAQLQNRAQEVDSGLRQFFNYIYQNVAYGLLVVASISFLVANVPFLQHLLFRTPLFFVVMLAPIGITIYLSARLNQISVSRAEALYWAVVASYGLLVSSIFMLYTASSIFSSFIIAGGVFFAASVYGRSTSANLSNMRTILHVGLWGLLVAMLVNYFIGSSLFDTAISLLAVVLFTGLIAYENHTLQNLYYMRQSEDQLHKVAIIGSLQLFISFMNLFIHLLRLLGTRRD